VLGAVPTIAGGLDESGDQRTRDLFHIAGIRSKAALRELNCAALIEQICAGLPEGGSVAG